MNENIIFLKIADINIKINCVINETSVFCKFKTEDPLDFIVINRVDKREINRYFAIDLSKYEKFLYCSNGWLLVDNDWRNSLYAPTSATFSKDIMFSIFFYANAVKRNLIQIHSSLVEYNGYGIMFLGPSGIGKTTQAELWNKHLDALIINGDIVYVEDKGREVIGWGTPWHGSSPYCENASVPVKALIILKQGEFNSLRRLDGLEMVSSVGAQVFYPDWIENGTELALETLDHILRGVPVYELVNRADEKSVMMVKQEVFGNEKD